MLRGVMMIARLICLGGVILLFLTMLCVQCLAQSNSMNCSDSPEVDETKDITFPKTDLIQLSCVYNTTVNVVLLWKCENGVGQPLNNMTLYDCERHSTRSRLFHNCTIKESAIMNKTILFYCTVWVDGQYIPYLYYRVTSGAGGKETNPLNDIPTEMITTAVTILQYITTNKATVTITEGDISLTSRTNDASHDQSWIIVVAVLLPIASLAVSVFVIVVVICVLVKKYR